MGEGSETSPKEIQENAIVKIVTQSLLDKADKADFTSLEILATEAETSGTLDRAIAVLEAQAAEADAPPAVHIALSVLYGRKGLKTKEYAALLAAEKGARQPGVNINIALVYGRKKLLAGSPEADSFMVGNLTVGTDPQGASVSLDGKIFGTTPITLEKLKAGSHTLVLALEGYTPVSLKTEINVGGSSRISQSLISANKTETRNQIPNDSFEYAMNEKNDQWWELYCDAQKGNFGTWKRMERIFMYRHRHRDKPGRRDGPYAIGKGHRDCLNGQS